jgi:hypothetical protein
VNDAEAAIASALYGGTSAPKPAPERMNDDDADEQVQIAKALYGGAPAPEPTTNVPDNIRALREGRSSLHDADATFRQALPDDAVPGADISEWRRCARDLLAEPDDARMFASLVAVNLETPADEAAVAHWRTQSTRLIQDNGYSQSDLDAARRLVARDPRVFALLERTGLESHPRVVDAFLRLARKARLRGQL